MAVLDVFRTTVGAAALGLARRALELALDRVRERRLFGAPLAELQMVQGHIADMALAVDASALLVYRAAWVKDAGAHGSPARRRWPSCTPPRRPRA
jgi:acyl-CoA dehydrogenase